MQTTLSETKNVEQKWDYVTLSKKARYLVRERMHMNEEIFDFLKLQLLII